MTNSPQSDDLDVPPVEPPAAVATTEFYETEAGVVLYDAENPLAWIQTDAAVSLADAE